MHLLGVCLIIAGALTAMTGFLVSRPDVNIWPTLVTGFGLVALGAVVLLIWHPNDRGGR